MIRSYLYLESWSPAMLIVHSNFTLNAFIAQMCSIKCSEKFFLKLFGGFHFTFSKYLKGDSR
jgi:hypothetical protein